MLERCKAFTFRRGLILVVLVFALLQYFPSTSMRKKDFTQLELTGCSSWPQGQRRQGCIVGDPTKPTTTKLVAHNDHPVVYFGIALKRRFSRAHRGSRHYRLVFNGTISIDGGLPRPFASDEETDAEGWTDHWELSFPRRIIWAKDIKKGQTVSIMLDYIKVYADRKSSEFADDFASNGVVEFALLAESDTNWVMQAIICIKVLAFLASGLILFWLCFVADRARFSVPRFVLLMTLGSAFLAATNPFSLFSQHLLPEEYFSNEGQVMLNYLSFTALEILMGFQVIFEAFPADSTSRRCLTPLLGIGYLIFAYVRHANMADHRDAANVYSDGEARVFRQAYFQTLAKKSNLLSSIPCFIASIFSTLVGKGFSPVSVFLGYMIFSWTQERHVLATFSVWKYARDLTMWVLGYLYLSTCTNLTHKHFSQPKEAELEEEHRPITATSK